MNKERQIDKENRESDRKRDRKRTRGLTGIVLVESKINSLVKPLKYENNSSTYCTLSAAHMQDPVP